MSDTKCPNCGASAWYCGIDGVKKYDCGALVTPEIVRFCEGVRRKSPVLDFSNLFKPVATPPDERDEEGGREMTNEQINIAIAEACGLDVIQNPHGSKDRPEAWKTGFFTPKAAKQRRISWPSSAVVKVIPDYCNDLNAMHEAEKVLTNEHHRQYRSEVWYSVCNDISSYECVKAAERPHFSATSHQRAEAFLKTIEKWEE